MPQRKRYEDMDRAERLDHLHRMTTALLERIEDMEDWEQVWEYEYKLFGVIPVAKRIQKKRWRPKRD